MEKSWKVMEKSWKVMEKSWKSLSSKQWRPCGKTNSKHWLRANFVYQACSRLFMRQRLSPVSVVSVRKLDLTGFFIHRRIPKLVGTWRKPKLFFSNSCCLALILSKIQISSKQFLTCVIRPRIFRKKKLENTRRKQSDITPMKDYSPKRQFF